MFSEDDYFRLLGRISVKFATLDLMVTELMLKLIQREEDNFDRPWEQATLGKKLKYLQDTQFTSEYGVKIKILLSDILEKAIEIAKERNRYIHDQWIFDPNSITNGLIDRIRLTSSGLKERSSLSIEDIKEFERKLAFIQRPFLELLQ